MILAAFVNESRLFLAAGRDSLVLEAGTGRLDWETPSCTELIEDDDVGAGSLDLEPAAADFAFLVAGGMSLVLVTLH